MFIHEFKYFQFHNKKMTIFVKTQYHHLYSVLFIPIKKIEKTNH